MKLIFITVFFTIIAHAAVAQTCNTPGQTPSTAFPVCGTSVFHQTTVPACGGSIIPGPCNGFDQVELRDLNPFWYKFTCFTSGTLGFTITPANLNDDYDWQIFDITGRDPNSVFTNSSLFVSCNWSGSTGVTGSSPAGKQPNVCATTQQHPNQPLFSSMPTLQQGHTYLLLVSHFTGSDQSGYDLSFKGGTAVITDPTLPALKSAEANCGGNIVRVKLNKKIKCSSLAGDGSDFFITPGTSAVTAVNGIGCAGGFDTDSVELTLNTFLPPGNYSLNVKQGTDGNTLLDYCGNAISTTDKVDFTVYPLVPTPMDSLVPVACAPSSLRLVFKNPILCSSVAANGSDFSITGPYAVNIASTLGNCTNGLSSKEIIINFLRPLYTGGTFTITLKTGDDGNTILDECGQETPAGSSLTFNLKDTVSADFTFDKKYGCSIDTVNFFHPGSNGVNSWQWNLDDNITSTQQNPQGLYSVFNQKNISLVVSNGFCTDSTAQTVLLDNFLKADFSAYEDNCPNEPVNFTGAAQGHIVQHSWSFGDGGNDNAESPTHIYAAPYNTTSFIVKYAVTDSIGCTSAAQKTINVYSSCYLAVPNAFTPNNDGKNDFLRVLNAIKAENLEFKIYNRWGQLVFKTNNWKQGWNGTINGVAQGSGVYVWFLKFTNRDTKEVRTMKGTATLIR